MVNSLTYYSLIFVIHKERRNEKIAQQIINQSTYCSAVSCPQKLEANRLHTFDIGFTTQTVVAELSINNTTFFLLKSRLFKRKSENIASRTVPPPPFYTWCFLLFRKQQQQQQQQRQENHLQSVFVGSHSQLNDSSQW